MSEGKKLLGLIGSILFVGLIALIVSGVISIFTDKCNGSGVDKTVNDKQFEVVYVQDINKNMSEVVLLYDNRLDQTFIVFHSPSGVGICFYVKGKPDVERNKNDYSN